METLAPFMTQFLWFLVVWSLLAYFVVWPWSLRLTTDMRLRFWADSRLSLDQFSQPPAGQL